MGEAELEYYRKREQSELAAAEAATSPDARRVHEQLASNYAALAKGEFEALIGPSRAPRRRLSIRR